MSDDDPGPDPADESADGEVPLAELAEDVVGRRDRPDDFFEEAFSERDFEALEVESLWSSVDGDESSGSRAGGESIEAGQRTVVVSKRNFCERCRFFSEPPGVHCTHEGTEIREFVDMDHVRLYDCPIVEERAGGEERPVD